MVTRLQALSISRWVQTGPIVKTGPVWHVLAVFEQVCDLATANGEVVALVSPEIGDGPLNIVVERLAPKTHNPLSLVQPGMVATLRNKRLRVGDLEIRLDQAATWEPRPNWERLRHNRAQIENRLLPVRDLGRRLAPTDSLLAAPWTGSDLTGSHSWEPVRSELVAEMAGLGGGLTPAGDDFLMGLMLQAWLAHPVPEAFCQQIAEIAAPRTTTLSAAMLRSAARGECSAAWHTLLAALEIGDLAQLENAVQSVLSHGHTSGADTLAGFLRPSPRRRFRD